MITANMKGFEQVKKNLDKLTSKSMVKVLKQLTFAGAKLVRDSAKEKVPTKSGALRKSIIAKRRRGTKDEVLASVGWKWPEGAHGHLIEFGHDTVGRGAFGESNRGGTAIGRVGAKPHIRPAFIENKNKIINLMISELQADKLSRRIIKPVKTATRGFTGQFG